MYPMHLLVFTHQHSEHESEGGGPSGRFWWTLGSLPLVIVVAVLLVRTVFFVDETEYVYVTQFGQPVQLYVDAGLHVKWPYQSLWRFDRRLQMYQPPAREMLTEDKENLNFQWFVCWRIPSREFVESQYEGSGNPSASWVEDRLEQYVRRFLQSVGTVQAAERRLEERIQAAIAAEIGRTDLEQLVSLDPSNVELQGIAERVTKSVRGFAADQFGIEVVDIRLKRFNYPEAVKPAVYAEIRSERERVAVQYRAEGASQKSRIESLADLERDKLLAQAKREATMIRGQAEARAIEIYNQAHAKNPEFYVLLKTLETYRSILDDQTTVVLSADSPLLKLLTRGLPEMEQSPAGLPSSEQPARRATPAAGAGAALPPAGGFPRVAEQQKEP